MDRLGIDAQRFRHASDEFVHLTADLGCRYMTASMVGFASAEAGVSAYDRLLLCVEGARSLLAEVSENC